MTPLTRVNNDDLSAVECDAAGADGDGGIQSGAGDLDLGRGGFGILERRDEEEGVTAAGKDRRDLQHRLAFAEHSPHFVDRGRHLGLGWCDECTL